MWNSSNFKTWAMTRLEFLRHYGKPLDAWVRVTCRLWREWNSPNTSSTTWDQQPTASILTRIWIRHEQTWSQHSYRIDTPARRSTSSAVWNPEQRTTWWALREVLLSRWGIALRCVERRLVCLMRGLSLTSSDSRHESNRCVNSSSERWNGETATSKEQVALWRRLGTKSLWKPSTIYFPPCL